MLYATMRIGNNCEYFLFQSFVKYYVTECNCVGFKITCKDKRKVTNRSKSNKSDQILVLKH